MIKVIRESGLSQAEFVPARKSARCKFGSHQWEYVTIIWKDGGPHMEWSACKVCGKIEDVADQVKRWPPFHLAWE